MLNKIRLLGVAITNETEDKVLEYIFQRLKMDRKKFFVVTPNPEILVYAHSHLDYKHKLNSAEVSLPDGVGVFLGAGLLGQPLKERIPGVDFIEELCKSSAENPISMGFLGGKPGVAKRAVECLMKKYPWIRVRWVGSEWNNELRIEKATPQNGKFHYGRELRKTDNNNNKSNSQLSPLNSQLKDIPWVSPYISEEDPIDILFVAFGFPKQEEWIYENLDKLPVRAAMGVGGAFDYISGDVIRAPYLIRAMGFEWLFRLIRQPWRIKRQFALVIFAFLLIKERLNPRRYSRSRLKRV